MASCAIANYVWLLAVMAYAFVVGDGAVQGLLSVVRRIRKAQATDSSTVGINGALYFCLASATGLAVVTQLLFVLGLLHGLYTSVIAVSLALLFVIALVHAVQQQRWQHLRVNPQNLLITCFFVGVSAYMVALSLNAPGRWDDTSFHLPLARFFLESHGLGVQQWLRYPLFPANANLLFVVSLAFGNELQAQVIASAVPLTLIAVGVYGFFSQYLRAPVVGLLAVLVLWSMHSVYEAIGYAYVDGIFMLYCWTGMLATIAALQSKDATTSATWIAICALLTGMLVGTKLFGSIIGGTTALIFLLRWGWRSRKFWWFFALASLFGLGWYLRSFVISGDPFHPAGTNIFGPYLWNAGDMALQRSDIHRINDSNPLHIPRTLISMGVFALVAGLLVIFQPRAWGVASFTLLAYVLVYLMVWWQLFPLPRYLMAIVPAGAVLAVLVCYRAGLDTFARLIVRRPALHKATYVLTLISLLVGTLVLLREAVQTAQTTIAQQQSTVQSRTGYATIMAANAQIPTHGDKLLNLGFENAIHFYHGTAIGDWFGLARYRQFLVPNSNNKKHMGIIVDENALAERAKPFGTSVIAINGNRFFFDPDQYRSRFDVQATAPGDYLLILKDQ